MLSHLAALSRSPWFRAPALLFALLVAVVMGPWMLVAVLAAPAGMGDGAVLSSASLGTMGVAGLLGLVGLLMVILIPARIVDRRPALAATLAALLGIGTVAALVGAGWSALGGVFEVAAGFVVLAAAGAVFWIGVFEGRRDRT